MNDEPRDRGPETAGGPVPISASGSSRRRAYANALRAAYRLAGVGPTGLLYTTDDLAHRLTTRAQPEVVERYRLLLVAAGIARGGPEGEAVTALLHRGYVPVPGAMEAGLAPGVWAIDAVALVWLAVGLPRLGQRGSSLARAALDVDAEALPLIRAVPAHVSLRIRKELRAEGHDLG